MTQDLDIGESILGLTNVVRLAKLIKQLEGRTFGQPGIGVMNGEPGMGKSFACAYAASSMDAIHIELKRSWTLKMLLVQLLKKLHADQRGTIATLMDRAHVELAASRRTLIIDQADYAIARGMIEDIRDLHDGSDAPLVLIGLENMPQDLRKFDQVESRVLAWVPADYADFDDTRKLAHMYARGITISDEMLMIVQERNGAVPRRMATDFAKILQRSQEDGLSEVTVQTWGKQPLSRNEPPKPRNRAICAEVDL